MRLSTYLLAFSLLVFGFGSCSYENASNIKPADTPAATCTDTLNVTYSRTIAPIFQANCVRCHGAVVQQNGARLDTYTEAKVYTLTGDLVPRIMHTPPYDDVLRAMPQGQAKLADCDIRKIRTWKRMGCPNN